jgi:hypothetical protein
MKTEHPVGDAWQKRKNGKAVENYEFDPENPLDWWFNDCPREELIECWNYEYARECPAEIKKALEWRENAAHPATFDELVNRTPKTCQVVALYPEWPRHPYLSIAPEERRRRRELMLKDAEPLLSHIQKSWTAKATFAVFDWAESDTELLRQFEDWVKRTRPKNEPIKESRGNAGHERKLLVRLKWLGAYRLTRHVGVNAAIVLTNDKGKPLYKREPDIAMAAKFAANWIKYLNKMF